MKISAKYSFINGLFTKNDRDAEFDFLIPGFIDIHCHGGGGKYFSEDVKVAAGAHYKAGTRIQLASLVTQEISKLVEQIRYLTEQDIFGIHLEGPYLSSKYCGAHDPKLLKSPTLTEVKMLLDAGKGLIKMITLAPELPGAIEVIKYLRNQGVVVAIGHSAANANETAEAISAGATVVTHFNNAMAKLGASDSLSELALKSDIFLELIQDGNHVSAADTFSIVTKAPNRIVAVTDAMAAAGVADGDYRIGDLPVNVKDKVAKIAGTNTLAGSTLTMLDAFQNINRVFGFEQAVKYTSINPAQVLGINPYDGYIAIRGKEVIHL